MESWRKELYSSELYHHGIKGQKWGKLNGPPYPLKLSSHSPEEKRKNPKSVIDGVPGNGKKGNSGHNNEEENDRSSVKEGGSIRGIALKKQYNNDQEFNEELLKKHPNAAVLKTKDFFSEYRDEIITGVGIAAIVAVGAYAVYSANKSLSSVDANTLGNTLLNGKEEYGGFRNNGDRFVGAWLHCDEHRYDRVDVQKLFSDPNENVGVSIKNGGILKRMVDRPYDSLRRGAEYVSLDGDDSARYKAFLPKMWRVNGSKKSVFYEMTIEANENIKAPGKADSYKIMRDALEQAFPGFSKERYDNDLCRNFYRYQAQLIDRDDPLTKRYFSLLSEKGYNACIDFNDAGRLSDTPLILLNGAKSGKVLNTTPVSMDEVRNAFNNIKPLESFKEFNVTDFDGGKVDFSKSVYLDAFLNA